MTAHLSIGNQDLSPTRGAPPDSHLFAWRLRLGLEPEDHPI